MGIILESSLLEAVTVLAGVFTLIYYFFKSKYNHWKNKGVPYLEPEFPYGNVKDMLLMRTSQFDTFKKLYDDSAGLPFVGMYLMWRPHLLVRDPELIKHVLVKDFTNFHDRGFFVDEELDPLSQHLLSLEGTKWRSLRTKLTPTFSSGKMKFMFQLMLECALQLENHIQEQAKNGKELEVKDMAGNFTTDVIGTCVFGLQFNSMKDPNSEFRVMGRGLFKADLWGTIKGLISTFTPSLVPLLRLKLVDSKTENFFIKAIADTIKYREDNGVTRNDFVQLLMQLKKRGKVHDDEERNDFDTADTKFSWKGEEIEFTDALLAAQAFIFFFAGFETSSTTISYALYELALNPEIQDTLQNEIDAALEQHGGFTYECVQEMSYLRKVVDETLRKHSVVPSLMRKTTAAYDIPNTSVHIEEGTPVFISVPGLHNDPKYYPDPERFDPERFSEENKAKRPNYVYLPFGDGPRNCIGMRFGLLQTKVGLAVLLSKFRFSVCEKTPINLKLEPKEFFPVPIGGMWLKITKRST